MFSDDVKLWDLKCLGLFHVSRFLALRTVHQGSRFKARSTKISVPNKTSFSECILMLGTLRTQSALITVKYLVFSKCVGGSLKFLILGAAGVTETQHIMLRMRYLGAMVQASSSSRNYCKQQKLLLYTFISTLFEFSILLTAKPANGLLLQLALSKTVGQSASPPSWER